MSGKNPNEPVVVKKVIKKIVAGGHGGSWKVAYADLVTALMAFFLLMWLLNMTTATKKQGLANYFKFYSMFDKESMATFEKNNARIVKQEADEAAAAAQGPASITAVDKSGHGSREFSLENSDFKQRLKDEIEAKLYEFRSQIKIMIFDDGVRIEIMDNEGKPIFPLGGSALSFNGGKIFQGICESIRDMDNKIIVEGHTDALSYASDKYTNWELSTDRASAARRALLSNGISPDRLFLVAGYAATKPLVQDNPDDPRNRRISLMLLIPNDRPADGGPAYEPSRPPDNFVPGKEPASAPAIAPAPVPAALPPLPLPAAPGPAAGARKPAAPGGLIDLSDKNIPPEIDAVTASGRQ